MPTTRHLVHGHSYRTSAEIRDRLAYLSNEWHGKPFSADARSEYESLSDALQHAEHEERIEQVRDAAGRGLREAGTSFGHDDTDTRRTRTGGPHSESRERALRAIEGRMSTYLSAEAGDRLCGLVERDRTGADARYLEAVSRPGYERAFALRVTRPDSAQFEMNGDEAKAMRDVLQAEHERASLTVGGGTLPIPATIDPTIRLTSDSAVNPLRTLARVVSITTSEWMGVTSAGTTATFAPELTPVTDTTPTLASPSIKAEKAHAFCSWSIEAGEDWPALANEIATVIADARDALEAEKFVAGDGTDEPEGLITGTTGTVAAGTAAFTVAHHYTLRQALPARFQPRAVFLSSGAIADSSWQLVAEADATNAKIWSDDRARLLGKPWYEVSEMDTDLTTGNNVLWYGSVADSFTIVDRIGMSIEIVPQLLDTTTNLPIGARGAYAWWRVGSAVTNTAAGKMLETT